MGKRKLDQRIQSLATKKLQMPAPHPIAKKDRAARKDTYKFGEIRCGGDVALACLFLNFSDTGVRIKLHCASPLPKQVRVVIPSTGFGRDAEVRWQAGAESGLEFID